MSPRRGGWPLWLVLVLLSLAHFYLRPRLYDGPGSPDFLLVALMVFAMRSRPGGAAVAGLIVGVVNDTLSPSQFGAGMLAHTTVAWLVAWGRAVFFADNLLVNFGLFFAGTWLRNLLLLLAGGVGTGTLLASLTTWSLLQAVTTAASGVLVVLIIRHRVDFRIEE